ncbi:MAG: cohesin domain-containing protein, partial [Oscillospiraceae bacterium]|nr:cohesin domain-containing protein [Oscillospiraceae bacterium]
MKRMFKTGRKRIFALLLAALLLAGLFPSAASAAGESAVLTPSAATVENGGDVSVALSVTGVPAYAGIQAEISYDPAKLTYKGVSPETGEGLLVVAYEDTPGTLLASRNGSSSVNAGATALTFTFTAKTGVSGTASFTANGVKTVAQGGGPDSAAAVADASASVTVSATSGDGSYAVTIDPGIENGTVTVDTTSVKAGDAVTVRVNPFVSRTEGYKLEPGTLGYASEAGNALITEKIKALEGYDPLSYYAKPFVQELYTFTMPA